MLFSYTIALLLLLSPMLTQVDIPSDLTDTDKALIFQDLDGELNSKILEALLYGIYTGILAVTLGNIFINKCLRIRRALVVVIILLHAMITITVVTDLSLVRSAFVENGQNFWTVSLKLAFEGQAPILAQGIASSISTIITDLYIIWCCWMVWGQCWPIVLLPILSLIAATVLKIIGIYVTSINRFNTPENILPTLYAAFILATTLWCTLLIIYRILTVTGVKRGAGSRLRAYHRFIEVLVESSALYSITLVIYLAFSIRNNFGMLYLDLIVLIAKGVAPTLLIGRAAAGHTRPQDDCDGSTVSSLHFQAPSEVGTTSFQESTIDRAVLGIDIEAQRQQSDESVVVVERT